MQYSADSDINILFVKRQLWKHSMSYMHIAYVMLVALGYYIVLGKLLSLIVYYQIFLSVIRVNHFLIFNKNGMVYFSKIYPF